jgi:hypothetical protein
MPKNLCKEESQVAATGYPRCARPDAFKKRSSA